MLRFSFRVLLAAVLLVALAVAPAWATPAPDGCVNGNPPGAKMGHFPSKPRLMSKLILKCSFNDNTGTSQASTKYTVHDFNATLYHNGAARTVVNGGSSVPAGNTAIQLSAAGNGVAGITSAVNRTITGPGLGPWTFVKSMTVGGLATLNRPTTGTVPAGASLKMENSWIRSVNDATLTAPDLLNSPTANFTPLDVGLDVTGLGIPANTTIGTWITATQVQLSATVTTGAPGVVHLGKLSVTTTARQLTGASITSAVRINSTAAGFSSSLGGDVGLKVVGGCDQGTPALGDDYTVPANVFITAIASAVNADTTGGLAAGQTGCNLTIGDPSYTAPLNGELALTQDLLLDLDPASFPGNDACSAETLESFPLIATWQNPGSFQGVGVPNQQPANTKAIAQLHISATGISTFSAFLLERRVSTTGDPIGTVHYDIQFPFHPAPLAMCPSTATSSGLAFELNVIAVTPSQTLLPFGYGRPHTARVRSILHFPSNSYTSTLYMWNDNTPAFTNSAHFMRVCIHTAGSGPFQCG